jgi:hypothetical protein
MGAARLRISSFPTIGEGAGAHDWAEPSAAEPVFITASHCFEGDSVAAVADGRIPASSNDPVQPRFTWWDHKGTREWILWDFPRKPVSKVRVYWFDDEPRGGRCRTPASWSLLYRWNGQWWPIGGDGTPGVERDRFNEVAFPAIETDALQIRVQLRPDFSGGILEWQIE